MTSGELKEGESSQYRVEPFKSQELLPGAPRKDVLQEIPRHIADHFQH